MLKTIRFKSLRTFAATLIATAVVVAPLPLSINVASAASIADTSGTYINGKISLITGLPTSSDKPPALSSFDVQVDGVSNPVTAFVVVGYTIIDLTLASTVYNGSVITLTYNAPPVDNSLNNSALQRTNGEDYASFINLPVTNLGPYRLNAPGMPTAIASEEGVTITVAAPTGGLTPRSYLVTSSPDGKTCTVDGPSGSCTITGLTAGVAYTFTTVAKTASGSSPAGLASASTTVLAKTAPNTPGVPTVAAGEESATITVTAPTSGLTPTSYEVTATPGGKTCTVAGASGSCTISGLTAGTAYTFTTIAKVSTGNSTASTASASTTVLAKTTITTTATTVPASTATTIPLTTIPAGYTPSWDKEPLTDSETDANTVGYFPAVSPGVIIITDEMGFTLDKKNGIKPKIRMKNYAGKIKMSISASYKVGAKTKKYKCTFAPFGTTKKIKTSKWRWYTPKKACILPAPLVAAVRANTATLSASGKWSRQWLTTSKKARPDKTKIKARTLKYTMKAKPAAVK